MSKTRVRTRSTAPLTGAVGPEIQAAPTEGCYQASMSADKFASFLTHPRQRDIERHAEYAKKRHLAKPSITQASVSAACLNGEYFKLDGHTRSYLWQTGQLDRPEKLTVTIYNVGSYQELVELYSHFDNKFAAENGVDVLSGVMRESGIQTQSQMFREYKFFTAIKYAFGYAMATVKVTHPVRHDTPDGLAQMVNFFRDEIILLDSIDPNLRLFKAAVTAGAFLTLKRRGEEVLPFFDALNTNRGVKTETTCDGVQALHQIILTGAQRARAEALLLTGRTVSCVEAWREGRMYALSLMGAARVKTSDLVDYTKPMRRERVIKEIGAQAARPSIEAILPARL